MEIMNPERLLSKHRLANGLTLEFWDRSRLAAGDRWQVVCEARVAVAISAGTLPPELQSRQAEMAETLGQEVVFVKQEVRNFVPVAEVPKLLAEMQSWLLKSLKTYLGHPSFAARFIHKKFTEAQERQRCHQK
jgi:hypothetical protein